jgi:hypothetical protein
MTRPEQVVINLFARLMTVTDLLQVVPTRLYRLFITSCYELVVMNLLTTCYVQTISELLEQLVASLLASSTLLQDDNNLFQTCQQLGTSSANTSANKLLQICSQVVELCSHCLFPVVVTSLEQAVNNL